MIKKILALSGLIISLPNNAAAMPASSNLHPSILLGAGYTRVGGAQNLWLATTPEPGLENTYTTTSPERGSFLLGFALEKTLITRNKIEGALGLEADYLRNPSVTGIVMPMVNVAPDFDTLNYSYDMTSYLLQATARLSMLNIISDFGAYLQAGVGGALNRLSDYTEVPPAGSSAAPMLEPFGNQSTTRFAYSIGAGILYQTGNSARFAIGYRYINAGSGSLNKSPVQETNHTLTFSPLSQHFLIFSLAV